MTSIPRIRPDDFEQLVRRHHLAVYRAALRVTRHEADAQDVTQQVFLALLEGKLDLARAADESAVLRWWAVRTALARLRGARRSDQKEASYAMQRSAEYEDPPIESTEEQSAVQQLVARLPEELRLPLELRFREELSFAAIGEALDVSENAAYQRVERGLTKLRGELGRMGLGALLPRLDGLLRVEPALSAPQGLATKLLALRESTVAAGFLSAPVLVGAGLVALLVVSATLYVMRGVREPELARAQPPGSPATATRAERRGGPEDEAAARDALAASESGARDALQLPAPPVPPATVPKLLARLTGSVCDEPGAPLGDAEVYAYVSMKGGRMLLERPAGRTRPDGRFEISVELARAEELLEVSAEHDDYVQSKPRSIKATAGATVAVPALAMTRVSNDPLGDFTLALTVVDEQGQAVSGVPVRIFRRGKNEFGYLGEQWEAGGLTDAFGKLDLAGQRLGSKKLVIEACDKGWRLHLSRIEVAAAGRSERRVQLERGAVLAGRVLTLDGQPAPEISLYVARVLQPELSGFQASTDAQGRFRVIGLDPGRCQLRVDGGGFAPGRVEVEAGREDLELHLKLSDEPRDLGDHMGELHGELRDALTGQPLEARYDAVEVVQVESRSASEFLAGECLGHLTRVARQVMQSEGWREPLPTAAFHLTGLEPGRYALVAHVAGHAVAFAGPYELGPTTLVAGIALEVQPVAHYAGLVIDASGAPLPEAWILVVTPDIAPQRLAELDAELLASAGRPRDWFMLQRTDAQGRFGLDSAPPGVRLRVLVLHTHCAPILGEIVEVRPAGGTIELRARSGR